MSQTPNRLSFVLVTLAVSLALTATSSLAQDPPPPWVELQMVEVNPTMVDEFIAVQRELSDRAKKANVEWRTVSRTTAFGNNYRFLVARPAETLASLGRSSDENSDLIALESRLQRCVTGQTTYAVRYMPDISNPLPEGEMAQIMVVTIAKITPGREREYIDVMAADVFPHFTDEEMHHSTGSLALGGEGGFIHVFHTDSFDTLDEGSPVMVALGTDGAEAVMAKLAGIVTSNEVWVTRVLPGASYVPEKEETDGRE